MKFGSLPLDQTVGAILAHQCVGKDGRRLFSKGHLIKTDDLAKLRAEGLESLVVAVLESGDLDENTAARRVGMAVSGENIRMVAPGVGRANLTATVRGILKIEVDALNNLNRVDEAITLATLRTNTLVDVGELIGLVKIIPYAVQESHIVNVESLAREKSGLLAIRPLQPCSVALIVTGTDALRDKLLSDFTDPVRTRVEMLDSTLTHIDYVPHTESAIAAALTAHAHNPVKIDVIIVAGMSATIDTRDVIPEGIRLAGGGVVHFGVPVDPGSLLVLGYLGDTTVMGAPGCIRSMKTNVIDLVLPRLFAGEHLTRADLVEMGHGGLLDDIEERDMPR
jgi:molybdenum cofactor cytidylyltransferase